MSIMFLVVQSKGGCEMIALVLVLVASLVNALLFLAYLSGRKRNQKTEQALEARAHSFDQVLAKTRAEAYSRGQNDCVTSRR